MFEFREIPLISTHSSEMTANIRAQSWRGAKIDKQVIGLASDLISIPSLPGKELEISKYLESFFAGLGWKTERIEVPNTDRNNLFVSFGTPRTIFTTHCDIVPGPEELFTPQVREGKLFGRGACDVKGALSAMISATHNLRLEGKDNFGLLVVVGEEFDGIGAKLSGRALASRGIEYIVNAEPTEGKLALGHTGVIAVEITFKGRACHSGYPDLGDDANLKVLRAAHALMEADYGTDPVLKTPVRTIGKIHGGTAPNQISDHVSLIFSVRTVHNDVDQVVDSIRKAAGDLDDLKLIRCMPPGKMVAVPGFETCIVRYGTDIPHLLEGLPKAKPLLFGPGSIHHAHTDVEHVAVDELIKSIASYSRIYDELSKNNLRLS